jgi:hypothetical protein
MHEKETRQPGYGVASLGEANRGPGVASETRGPASGPAGANAPGKGSEWQQRNLCSSRGGPKEEPSVSWPLSKLLLLSYPFRLVVECVSETGHKQRASCHCCWQHTVTLQDLRLDSMLCPERAFID